MSKKSRTTKIVLLAIAIVIAALIVVLLCITNPQNDYAIVENSPTRFIAHRGYSGLYYQNSALAFEKATEEDFFYGIETDLWLTSDGKWICCHDETPFADKSIKITEITFTQARNIAADPALASPDVLSVQPTYLASLDEYLDILAASDKVAIIELKFLATTEQLTELHNIVSSKLPDDRFQYIAFDEINAKRLEKINAEIVTQRLDSYGVFGFFSTTAGINIGVSYKSCTKALVNAAHSNKCFINVYTVNDSTLAQKYIDMGVDFITTNYVLNINIGD